MQFRVVFACILLQKPKKPLRSVDDADDELDDASSVQIILLIRIVHIIFFRISTQKALRATLLRGCFLVSLTSTGPKSYLEAYDFAKNKCNDSNGV